MDFRLDPQTESSWATQQQIADLFQTERSNVTKHLKNIFEEGELEVDSDVNKLHIAGSTKPVSAYSLDAVISVGYRVNSKTVTRFRQWATQTALKASGRCLSGCIPVFATTRAPSTRTTM